MQVIVCRHGIAERESPDGTDYSRRLTETGVSKTTEVASGLLSIADRPDVILHSPLVRAVQTAEIIGEAFDSPLESIDELADGSPARIVKAIQKRKEETVMLVGHEPTLGRLISLLAGGENSPNFAPLKKAACACLDVPIEKSSIVDSCQLVWLATPKMLRKLGGGD